MSYHASKPILSLRSPKGIGAKMFCCYLKKLNRFVNFPYFRVCFIFSLNSSSHACALIARIPETTWFVKEIRISDSAAERRRSAALTEDISA